MCWLNVLKHVLCYIWLINGILTVCWEGKHKNLIPCRVFATIYGKQDGMIWISCPNLFCNNIIYSKQRLW